VRPGTKNGAPLRKKIVAAASSRKRQPSAVLPATTFFLLQFRNTGIEVPRQAARKSSSNGRMNMRL